MVGGEQSMTMTNEFEDWDRRLGVVKCPHIRCFYRRLSRFDKRLFDLVFIEGYPGLISVCVVLISLEGGPWRKGLEVDSEE